MANPPAGDMARQESAGAQGDTPGFVLALVLVLLLPLFLDSLRVTFGVPLMSFFAVSTCLVIWLARAFAAHRVVVQPSAAYVLLLLMGASAFLSTTSPIGAPFSKLYRAASFSYTRLFMVFLLINLVRSLDQVRRAMSMVIGLGAVSAVVALWQFWMYEQTGINYSFAQGEAIFRVTPTNTYLRATALASQPNEIGIVLAVAAVWCLYAGFSEGGIRRFARIGLSLLFFLLLSGVIVTFSRGALVSLFFGVTALGVAIPLLRGRGARVGVALTIGVLGVTGLAVMLALSPMFEEASGDVLWRIDLNRLGIQAVLENPLTGVGVDSFSNYDNAYDLEVHNLFIQVAAELGLFGLLLFVLLTGSLLVRLLRAAWTAPDARSRSVLVAVTLGYVTKLIFHVSSPILTDLFFWFCLGLGEAVVSVQRAHAALGREWGWGAAGVAVEPPGGLRR